MCAFEDEDDFGQIGNTLGLICYTLAHLVNSMPPDDWRPIIQEQLSKPINQSKEELTQNEAIIILVNFAECWKKKTRKKESLRTCPESN